EGVEDGEPVPSTAVRDAYDDDDATDGGFDGSKDERQAQAAVELKDALQRIVRQHWVLIGCFVVVCTIIGAFLGRHPTTYTASTRLVLGTDDPKSRTESASIADTGKAIATSPAEVRGALQDAHVDRNAN